MSLPKFEVGQEVHVAQQHCNICRKLEGCLKHPLTVQAVLPYGDRGFSYRVHDAVGAHYEVAESCLCTDAAGHSQSPCIHCGQAAA
jgi:hypothetical protein